MRFSAVRRTCCSAAMSASGVDMSAAGTTSRSPPPGTLDDAPSAALPEPVSIVRMLGFRKNELLRDCRVNGDPPLASIALAAAEPPPDCDSTWLRMSRTGDVVGEPVCCCAMLPCAFDRCSDGDDGDELIVQE